MTGHARASEPKQSGLGANAIDFSPSCQRPIIFFAGRRHHQIQFLLACVLDAHHLAQSWPLLARVHLPDWPGELAGRGQLLQVPQRIPAEDEQHQRQDETSCGPRDAALALPSMSRHGSGLAFCVAVTQTGIVSFLRVRLDSRWPLPVASCWLALTFVTLHHSSSSH